MKKLSLILSVAFAILMIGGCSKEQSKPSATSNRDYEGLSNECGCHCRGGKVTAGSLLVQNESLNFTFSFHGDSEKKEGDIGEFNYVNHITGVHRHGDVTCLVIIDNVAWFVGVEGDNSETPGARAVWKADDNGEGANDPVDQVSVPLFNQSSSVANSVCDCHPSINPTLINIAEGNIQFHKDLEE
ncbi:hypothetical protein [Solitalea lacus]|uniref:hypothetical protein n=1 Tax=Solitalea lacus TaxID=2911172 RepID=UPI001EDAA463|nr:hypothetical protein [Solitalea lacus]UKJ09263.1 hypothetical protein L2B55_08915 [Solitalea lacus]